MPWLIDYSTYGSAIRRSVSFTIRFGKVVILGRVAFAIGSEWFYHHERILESVMCETEGSGSGGVRQRSSSKVLSSVEE